MDNVDGTDTNVEALSVVYCQPELTSWLQLSDDDPLTFEKELIYEGQFQKDDLKFGVNYDTLRHWKHTYDSMRQNGINIPMPLEHTANPEAHRAVLTGIRIGKNTSGKNAAFGRVKFNDEEAAKLAKSSDVSIFVAPEFQDGNGNMYKRPIRHVAFTNYPVIPGLEKFQAIAASFMPGAPPMQQGMQQPQQGMQQQGGGILQQIAQLLGVQMQPGMNEQMLGQMVLQAVQAMKGGGQQQPKPMGGAPPMGPHSQAMASMLRENRTTKLDGLVLSGHITKASRDKLEAQFCSETALALAFSENIGTDQAFDNVLAALRENKVMNYDERTGKQIPDAAALSNPMRFDNPVLANANARAAAVSSNGN